jgi:hypothetical protein
MVRVHGSQESGTYRLLHRDPFPATSLQRLIDFSFIGTSVLAPHFRDYQPGSESCQHEHLSQMRHLGHHRACHSNMAVGAGSWGNNEVEQKDGEEWRQWWLASRWGAAVGAGAWGDDELESKEGGEWWQWWQLHDEVMGLEMNRPSPGD